jgi:hypothetical protein
LIEGLYLLLSETSRIQVPEAITQIRIAETCMSGDEHEAPAGAPHPIEGPPPYDYRSDILRANWGFTTVKW